MSTKIKIDKGGIARTTNPTTVLNGQEVTPAYDVRGRNLVTYQARELVATAFASLTNGTETSLLGGTAGEFHDLVSVTCANTSTATIGAGTAATVDIRDATGGGVVASMTLQDETTHTIYFNPPLPQNVAGAAWTADMDDITGTTVNVTALFIKNN